MIYQLRFLLIAIILVTACKKKSKENYSSPESRFKTIISSHTGGVVSKTAPIRIELFNSINNVSKGDPLPDGTIRTDPEVNGEAYWENSYTLIFQPEKLEGGQTYGVEVFLDKIIPDIPKDKEVFRFSFDVIKQDFEAELNSLDYEDPNNLRKVRILGKMMTADVLENQDLSSLAIAKQNDRELKIKWEKVGPKSFDFSIDDVIRSEEESLVQLDFNGKTIGVDKSFTREFKVPSLKDFKVISGTLYKSPEKFISLVFSDPLDADQDLTGLVSLAGDDSNLRLILEVNKLKIFPKGILGNEQILKVKEGVKNSAGFSLGKDYEQSFYLEQLKPQIAELEEMDKTILPSSTKLSFPFRAAGLNAVDIAIVKIFPNNVLQYLQVNRLGENDEIKRVARPEVMKTIPLKSNGLIDLNDWNTFSINIEEFIEPSPGAIYQVIVGFRKEHSRYDCGETASTESQAELINDWETQDESSYWDNYQYYYPYGFNWSERDNPCSDSYYGSRKFIKKVLFSSDLGIIAKNNGSGALAAFITDLNTTEPQENVKVEIYDYQEQLIQSGISDDAGMVNFDIDRNAYALIARKGNDVGYLRLDDGTSLSVSSFDVSGNKVQKGLKGFIYGERGVWRPGDTIHVGFILEKSNEKLPEAHPVIAELIDPMNQIYDRQVKTEAIGNMYRFDFVTSESSPTGFWRLKTKVGGASFSKSIRVETIKPNRLKINLSFDKEVLRHNDKQVKGNLNVRWLSGGTASGLKVLYDIQFKPVKTSFDNYPGFQFDDPSLNLKSEREQAFKGRLDDQGNATINFDLSGLDNAPGAVSTTFYGTVFEQGGDKSISSKSLTYYPYESFVGISLPEGDKNGMLLTDEDHEVQIVALDSYGNPVNKSNLEVSLYKLNWRWWWDKTENDISNYLSRNYSEPLQRDVVKTVNGKAKWNLRINYPQWGRYFIKVYDPESGHSSGQIFYMDWPGWAAKGKRGDLSGASRLDFSVEKEEYKVGEEINISVPSTEGNRILVSLESGNQILDAYWLKTEKNKTDIRFEASKNMAPNVYAHITMIQPHSQLKNDLPIRMYGIQSIKVVDDKTRLIPEINMPDELRPEEVFDVKVSEASDRAMTYTLAIVDEGLLDITNYKTPDPWSSFYGREALGVKTWDVYDDVIGAFAHEITQLLAIGGDAEIKSKKQSKVNRFKPVVKFLGPFELKAGETATHSVRMPQYVGSVKTMLVASSGSGYGHAEISTPVRQPLMILATLPRVAGPKEKIKLPVNVFLNGKSGEVNISVKSSGALKLSGDSRKKINLKDGSDGIVFFDLEAEENIGPAKVMINASSGNLKSKYDVEINVIPRNPEMNYVQEEILKEEENKIFDYSPLGLRNTNEAAIEVSFLPPLNLEKRLSFLVKYPHGCVEQTTSAVFAQLFLDKLTNLDQAKRNEIQKNINSGIKRLKKFQSSGGAFRYWPGNTSVSYWGTNYAGHFLVEAAEKGYAIPQKMLNDWLRFQKEQANSWTRESGYENNDLVQAYRLYTLARSGNTQLGAMNRMKSDNGISIAAKWRLALAYASSGYENQAKEIIAGLSDDVETKDKYRVSTFGSSLRDRAMILETQIYLKKENEAFKNLLAIAGEMANSSRWMSTQTTAYCFIGISKYFSMFSADKTSNVTVSLKNVETNLNGSEYVQSYSISNADDPQRISITNNGGAPVFVRLIRSGIPIEGAENATEKNIRLDISFTDRNGNLIDVSKLRQGTEFLAKVNVLNPKQYGNYNELALTQIFPSGWEIVNTRLDGSSTNNSKAEYIDIRDDRVMHYFDLRSNEKLSFEILLQAAYQGRFYQPASSVGAMYDNDIFANTGGKWVEVIQDR